MTPAMADAPADSWLGRRAAALVRRPRRWAVVLGLVFAVLAAGGHRLRLDFSSRSFFAGDDAAVAKLDRFHKRWGVDDNVLMVVVRVHDRDLSLTDESVQSWVQQLADALRAAPHVQKVTTAFDTPAMNGTERTPVLLSKDGRVAGIVVELDTSSDDVQRITPVVDDLRSAASQVVALPGVDHEFGGVPAIRAGFFHLTIRDQMRLVPAMLGVMALILWWMFRRAHGVLVPAVASLIPLIAMLGVMGWVGEPIGLLNQAYFTLIPVIAVADAIHILARYTLERRHHAHPSSPSAAQAAIVSAVARLGMACLWTSVTTGFGLVSLTTAQMPILRHFGVFAAIGVGFAYATMIGVVPLVLALRPGPEPQSLPPQTRLAAPLARVAAWSMHRSGALILMALLVCGACGWAATRVAVDNRLTGLLRPDHPVSQASQLIDDKLGGVLNLELEADIDGVAPDAFADAFARLQDWARSQSNIRSVHPPRFTDNRRRARVTFGLRDTGGQQFVTTAQHVSRRWNAELAPLGGHAEATGTPLLAYRGVNRIAGNLRTSLVLAFVTIAVVIGLLFRSLRLALVSLVPNAMPLVVGYALLGWSDQPFDPLAAVILVMALGIAVDDTIHIMVRVREQLATGADLRAAITVAVSRSGTAVTVTTVVLCGGLGVNLLSSFPPLVMLATLGTTVIATALVCDLTVLPALLLRLTDRRHWGVRG